MWTNLKNALGARDNLLKAWPPSFFRKTFIPIRFLHRMMYVINDPQGVQHVMVGNASNYIKSPNNTSALKPLLGKGLFVSEGDLWVQQRRISQPALRTQRIKGYAEEIVRTGLELVEQWEAKGDGAELELTEEMANVTAEVITRTMFGDKLGDRTKTVFDAFKDYQESLGRVRVTSLVGLPDWLPRLDNIRGRRAVKRMDTVIYSLIQTRKESGQEHDDLLDMLLNALVGEHGTPLPMQQIRDEVASIFLAGHETTAITLSWVFYLLDKHPEMEARLLEELDTVLEGRAPAFEDFPKLIYTRALIEETLRLYPPVHVFSRIALKDDVICGQPIAAKSFVTISAWLLHRHEKYWDEPEVFRPERFLPENASKIVRNSYIPFGLGPRICLGKNFGLMESVLMLALLAQRFELRLKKGHPVEPVGKLTLRPSDGLPMTITRRVSKAAHC